MNSTYNSTGTLSPLMSLKNYSEEEKIVLNYFFTNTDKNVYCATDNMSSQLWAFLTGQYSRSTLSLRDRFLELLSDAEKLDKEGSSDSKISIASLAKSIQEENEKDLKYFNSRASKFLKKWGVDYGHNSLKDADQIRIAVEGVSQVFTKVIEAPYPCIGSFQEKSTRYVDYGSDKVIYSEKILNSEYGERYKSLNEKLMNTYLNYLPKIKKQIVENGYIKKEDFNKRSAFKRTVNAKAFDIVRYLLPTGVQTCIGATLSTRTLETHLSWMLSHELAEVRMVAKTMHEEAVKVSPGLLSHVGVNQYFKTTRESGESIAYKVFKEHVFGEIKKGISDEERVSLLKMDDVDSLCASSILYNHSRVYGKSFSECEKQVSQMTDKEKEEIIDSELSPRGDFDSFPRTFQHGRIRFEFLTDFGAYRDYQRHRASSQIWQRVSAVHGYDYPEYINDSGFEEFKAAYDQVMTELCEFSREIIVEFPHESEYVAALGHLIRTTFDMHPGQLAYIIELRTTPQGHHSYRQLFQKVYQKIEKNAPFIAKHIRVSKDLEGSRKKQEERSVEKYEQLIKNTRKSQNLDIFQHSEDKKLEKTKD